MQKPTAKKSPKKVEHNAGKLLKKMSEWQFTVRENGKYLSRCNLSQVIAIVAINQPTSFFRFSNFAYKELLRALVDSNTVYLNPSKTISTQVCRKSITYK